MLHKILFENLSLKKFKSIKDQSVKLKPLTVVVGRNSSGKSSLIQSMLLLTQAATSETRQDQSNRSIDMNGPLVNLGNFDDVLNFPPSPDYNPAIDGPVLDGEFTIAGRVNLDLPSSGKYEGRLSASTAGDALPDAVSFELDFGAASFFDTETGVLLDGQDDKGNTGFIELRKGSISPENRGAQLERLTAFPAEIGAKYINNNERLSEFDYQMHGQIESFLDSEEGEYPDFEIKSQNLYAMNFRFGLPFSGLVASTRLQRFIDVQQDLWELAIGPQRRLLFALRSRSAGGSRGLFGQGNSERQQDARFKSWEDAVKAYVDAAVSIFLHGKSATDEWEHAVREPRFLIPFQSIPFYVVEVDDEKESTSARIPINDISTYYSESELKKRNFLGELEANAATFWLTVKEQILMELEKNTFAQEECLVLPARGGTRILKSREDSVPKPFLSSWALYEFEKRLSSVRYLGPLRIGPKHLYSRDFYSESVNLPLGHAGEVLARVLYKNEIDSYPLPTDSEWHGKKIHLRDAVNEWLKWLGLSRSQGPGVVVEIRESYGYKLTVDGRGLPGLGTGVSQVLPVVVLCLLTPVGGVALLEEPELHLNPGAQQKLAEFFLQIANMGRQIIVETHSEYIVTRLRKLAALEPNNGKAMTFVFTEIDERLGTLYQNVYPEADGLMPEWPSGFFDQATDDYKTLIKKAIDRGQSR